MTLTTPSPSTTTSERPGLAVDNSVATPPSSRRRGVVASWAAVGLGVLATGAFAVTAIVAATGHDAPAGVSTSQLAIERGSVSAVDHRDELLITRRNPTETVAERGSVSAVDHRDELLITRHSPSETVAQRGSVSAIDHRNDDGS